MSSTARAPAQSTLQQTSRAYPFWHSAWHAALGSVALGVVTAVGFVLQADDASAALLYLFVIVLTSLRTGRAAGLMSLSLPSSVSTTFLRRRFFTSSIGEIDAVAVIVFGTTVLVISHLMTDCASRSRKSNGAKRHCGSRPAFSTSRTTPSSSAT